MAGEISFDVDISQVPAGMCFGQLTFFGPQKNSYEMIRDMGSRPYKWPQQKWVIGVNYPLYRGSSSPFIIGRGMYHVRKW